MGRLVRFEPSGSAKLLVLSDLHRQQNS